MPLLASFWFSALVTFSTRSAALVSAAAIAVCAVLLRSKSLDALPRLGEFVCHDNRQHNDQSGISNLAAFAAQTIYPVIYLAGEVHQVAFLTILAGHPELLAVDCYTDSGHSSGQLELRSLSFSKKSCGIPPFSSR